MKEQWKEIKYWAEELMRDAMKKENIEINKEMEEVIEKVYRDDMVDAYFSTMIKSNEEGEIAMSSFFSTNLYNCNETPCKHYTFEEYLKHYINTYIKAINEKSKGGR